MLTAQSVSVPKDLLASAEWQKRIDDLAVSLDIPGAQVGVLMLNPDDAEDAVIRVINTGVASRSHGAPVNDRTHFHYGSISKVWTTTLLMQLIDEGKLTLDTTIAEVLPNLRTDVVGATEQITVRHLLTHTSGIEGDFFRFTGEDEGALNAYLDTIPEAQSITHPGGPHSYCNSGFSIAGAMAVALRGELWDELIVSQIAKPLGVTDIFSKTADAGLYQTAAGHNGSPAEPTTVWQLPRALGPAGLIAGTADTMLRFAASHLRDGLSLTGDRVLSSESAIAMRTEQHSFDGVSTTMTGWGFGWALTDWGTPAMTHSGGTIGQNANLTVFPELGIAICILTNSGVGSVFVAQLEELIAKELGLTRPVPRDETPEDQSALRDLIGCWSSPWMCLEITEDESGVVRASMSDAWSAKPGVSAPSFPLRAAGQNRFLYERSGRTAEISRVNYQGREFIWTGRLLERSPEPFKPAGVVGSAATVSQ